MAIIRFSDEEVFGVDSQEYEILVNAAAKIGETPGAVVEIGTRRGGSAKMIIDTLVQTGNTNRSMFCIDPYGNIEIECTNLNMSIHNPERQIEGDKMSKRGSKHSLPPTLAFAGSSRQEHLKGHHCGVTERSNFIMPYSISTELLTVSLPGTLSSISILYL